MLKHAPLVFGPVCQWYRIQIEVKLVVQKLTIIVYECINDAFVGIYNFLLQAGEVEKNDGKINFFFQ